MAFPRVVSSSSVQGLVTWFLTNWFLSLLSCHCLVLPYPSVMVVLPSSKVLYGNFPHILKSNLLRPSSHLPPVHGAFLPDLLLASAARPWLSFAPSEVLMSLPIHVFCCISQCFDYIWILLSFLWCCPQLLQLMNLSVIAGSTLGRSKLAEVILHYLIRSFFVLFL